jgi:hypothetical protein
LGDYEVVYVEELSNSGKRRFAFFIVSVAPGLENDVLAVRPGNDRAGFILAVDCHGRVEGVVGCIGSNRGRPD